MTQSRMKKTLPPPLSVPKGFFLEDETEEVTVEDCFVRLNYCWCLTLKSHMYETVVMLTSNQISNAGLRV